MRFGYALILFVCSVLILSAAARADQQIQLQVVDAMLVDTCLAVPRGLKKIHVASVLHRGQDEAIGFTRQGDVTEKVFSATDVKSIVKESVTKTLERCGYQIGRGSDALRLTVAIDEFFGGARNKFLVGKGKTKVALDFDLATPDENSHYTFRFSNETDLKGVSGKKLKRLGKSLNGILVDVMKQVASSQALLNGAQDLSKY